MRLNSDAALAAAARAVQGLGDWEAVRAAATRRVDGIYDLAPARDARLDVDCPEREQTPSGDARA